MVEFGCAHHDDAAPYMFTIQTLLNTAPPGTAILSEELQRQYGGDLQFPAGVADRPYVIGNFVSTLDGIVSFAVPGREGGGEISGHDEADRFIMGLLRASADAVMVGSGTVHATAPGHAWVAESVYPEGREIYAAYRAGILGKKKPPYSVIVSGSGIVDLDRRMFRSGEVRIVILTTGKGAERLRGAGAASLPATDVLAVESSSGAVEPAAMLDVLQTRYGVHFLLHEGGPTLYGEFLAADLVDEMFVTVSPHIAGSSPEQPRPTMVWGTEFPPESAPWLQLLSVKQSADHLYLRYRRRVKTPAAA